jgi:hypothetical protein
LAKGLSPRLPDFSPYIFRLPGGRLDRMRAQPALRVSFMTLPQLVDRYLALAGQYRQPVALSSFALPSGETERLFSSFDEDYHISRFFLFSSSGGQAFSIDGVPATHVSIDAEIQSVL